MAYRRDHLEEENLLTNMEQDDIIIISDTGVSGHDTNLSDDVFIQNYQSSFKAFSSKVNWTVFFCICLFTLGSWLDICAIWSELVYLVDELPEGWRLPSILNYISVIAQLGPIGFSIGRYFYPKKFTFERAIYVLFTVGIFSCLALALFWNKTAFVFGERRSVYLYIFNFTLSLLDGISTITFLPYIGGHFSKEYIIPNYIGESLSSLIPGLFAIIQSVGVSDECVNPYFNASSAANYSIINNYNMSGISVPSSHLASSKKLTPNYSVSTYFIIMMFLLMGSMCAFSFLHFSKTARKARKSNINSTETIKMSKIDLVQSDSEESNTKSQPKESSRDKNRKLVLLFTLTFFGAFIQYGYLPGLFSYSTIPYGHIYFHLSINLSSVLLPIAIFFSIWSYKVSVGRIVFEFTVAASFAAYIILVSFQSPCPIFVDTWFGGYLIVLSWVICSCVFLRIRCLIASTLEAYGENILFIFGMVTIAGQVIGGTIIFVSVDIYHMFKEKDKCSLELVC